MPGLIPRVLRAARELTGIPVIAGGLIEEKSEVIEAACRGRGGRVHHHQGVWSM